MGRTELSSKVVLFASTILAAYAFPLLAYLLQLRASGDLPDGAHMPHSAHGTGQFVFHLALLACCVSATGIFAGCVQTERSEAARMLGMMVVVAQGAACFMIVVEANSEMDQCHETDVATYRMCRHSIAVVYSLGVAIGTVVLALFPVLASAMEAAAVEEEAEEEANAACVVGSHTAQQKGCPAALTAAPLPPVHGLHYFVLTPA